MKVLISDSLSERGLAVFKKAPSLTVDFQPNLGKDVEKLKIALKDADAIAIRSATKLTKELLEHAPKLKVIGRAGIGVDNVDIPEATKRGIIVMNTPGGNTVTTAEHAISMMCALTRSIPQATTSTKAGKWEKNKFMGSELYNKTLGVVGLGNIGKIVADRALGLRMKVIAYDPFLSDGAAEKLGVDKVDLEALFARSDYITLHVPKTDKTTNLLNRAAFAKMKRGVYIINCARGGIINEAELATAIQEGIVAGAALDVFEMEPVDPNNPLLKLEQVICTPHLGASTEEAQENVAVDVAEQIVDFLVNGTVQNALNFPSVSGEMVNQLKPFVSLAKKLGSLQGQLAEQAPNEIHIEYCGDLGTLPTDPLTVAVIQGILEPVLDDVTINPVNASVIAKERGIKIVQSKVSENDNYTSLLTIKLVFPKGERLVSGTIFGKIHPRIVRLDSYYLEAIPEGQILIIVNQDKPGVVGNIGTALAQHGINISRMQLGLDPHTKLATSFYNVEGRISPEVLKTIASLPGLEKISLVNL